jgi:hypothetical protein
MQAKATSSACSDKQAHLAHRLHEAVPHGAKLALCFDPEGDLSGLDDIIDAVGRTWRIVTYQEDDLAFRLAMRMLEAEGWIADSPVLLRVAMPDLVPLMQRINLSFLGVILQRVEGEPIDLRTDAVVTFHTEPVVWPEHLQAHATRISRDLKGFIDGYWWMRKTLGPDRPLGRHHIEVALLLARYQEWTIAIWNCPKPIWLKSSLGSCRLSQSTSSTPKTDTCFGKSLWAVGTCHRGI